MSAHSNSDLLARSLSAVWHPCTQMKRHETLPLVAIACGQGIWLHDFGINLRDLAARQLLVEEGKLDNWLLTKALNELDGDTQHLIITRMEQLKDFSINAFDKWNLTDNASNHGLKLVADKDGNPVSRAFADSLCTTADDFSHSGVLFFVPMIEYSDDLRLGNVLTDKNIGFFFHYTDTANPDSANHRQEDSGYASVTAKDYATAANNVFFGDRPLDNPGYSKFELSGEVGVGKANDVLDVYRVEQRLRYLGFPAMGYVAPVPSGLVGPMPDTNQIQDFTVDGVWGEQEARAAYLFNQVVNYDSNNSKVQLVQRGKGYSKWTGTVNSYYDALTTVVNGFTVPKAGTSTFDSYLNAYNAPHWMNVFQSLQGAGGVTVVNNMNAGRHEEYGTSWMRDLIRAYSYADSGFQNSSILFGGATDANHGLTPTMHGTHDLGMAFDLGVRDSINTRNQNNEFDVLNAAIATAALTDPSGRWSKINAVTLLGLLPSDRGVVTAAYPNGVPDNDQQSALNNFLALYDITQKGSTGARDALTAQIKSAGDKNAILDALFGAGTQSTGLIAKTHIGSMTKINGQLVSVSNQNPYYSIRKVLDRLGIANSPAIDHNTHFHIYLKPPTARGLTQNLLADTTDVGNLGNPQTDMAALAANQALDISYTEDPQTGEFTMLLSLLVPAVPPLVDAPVALPAMVAQATTTTSKPDMTLGDCEDVQTPDNPDGQLGGGYNLLLCCVAIGTASSKRYLLLRLLK